MHSSFFRSGSQLVSGRRKTVTDAVNRLNVGGLLRFQFNLFPDPADVNIDAAGRDGAVIPPNIIKQLVAGKNHSGVRRHIVQEPEFQRAKFDQTSGDADAVRHGIDDDVPAAHLLTLRRRPLIAA